MINAISTAGTTSNQMPTHATTPTPVPPAGPDPTSALADHDGSKVSSPWQGRATPPLSDHDGILVPAPWKGRAPAPFPFPEPVDPKPTPAPSPNTIDVVADRIAHAITAGLVAIHDGLEKLVSDSGCLCDHDDVFVPAPDYGHGRAG